MNIWLAAILPGVHYYSTRYRYRFQAFCHLLKYWGVFVLMLCLMIGEEALSHLPILILGWAAFQSVYDWFALENDRRAEREGEKGTRRLAGKVLPPLQLGMVKAGVVIACAAGGLFFVGWDVGVTLWQVIAVCALVFWLHNRARSGWRLLTFYLLYMLKSMLVVVVFWDLLLPPQHLIYLCFACAFNFTYLPMYIMAKRNGVSVDALFKDNKRARLMVTPFFYKLIPLVCVMLYDVKMVLVLALVVSVTAVEFIRLKRLRPQA